MSPEHVQGSPVPSVDDFCPDRSKPDMAQRFASFFKTSWFPALTLCWLIMSGSWEKVFALRGHDEAIKSLKETAATIPAIDRMTKANDENIRVNTSDLSELKKAYFSMVHDLSVMQRNVDRMSWVLEALAEKNGIKVPPPIEK